MATTVNSRPIYKRFLGNKSHMEVHDLNNEDTRPHACQINEIIKAGNAVVFSPDTFEQAHSEGFDPCDYCMEGSER